MVFGLDGFSLNDNMDTCTLQYIFEIVLWEY